MKSVYIKSSLSLILLLFVSVTVIGCTPATATPIPDYTHTTAISVSPTATIVQTTKSPTGKPAITPSPLPTISYKYGSQGKAPLAIKETLKVVNNYKAQDEKLVLNFNFEAPLFSGSGAGVTIINEKTDSDAFSVEHDAEDLAEEAKSRYAEYPEDFFGYYLEQESIVEFNKNGILSLHIATDEYTGGPHPNRTVSSKTFDTATGKLLTLGDLFNISQTQFRLIIDNEIINQIEKLKADYGEDFVGSDCAQYVKNKDLQNAFYLSDEGIVIYFNTYELAPHAYGTLYFTIAYDKLSGKLNFPAE